MINYAETIKQSADNDKYYESWLFLEYAKDLVYRAREMELQRYNLTPERAQVLAVLNSAEENLTPAMIARLIFRKPHTMVTLLRRMAKDRQIKKIPLSKGNGRGLNGKFLIVLTDKGREDYKLASKRGPIHRIMAVLSEEENEQFHLILNKIMLKASEEVGLNRDLLPPSE